jgi:glycosyltransferase involved in cell wall biosynthesis
MVSRESGVKRLPLVSVIVATRNGAATLSQALNSVAAQDYASIEVIVIDDGSEVPVTRTLMEKPQVDMRVVRSNVSQGQAAALNRAIDQARGRYVAILDDDDVWTDRKKIAKQITFLLAHPMVGLCGTQAIVGSEIGEALYKQDEPLTDAEIRRHMLYRNNFVHSSVVIPTALLRDLGGYNEDIQYAADYELWLRVGLVRQLANLPDFCVLKRQMSTNIGAIYHRYQYLSFLKRAWQYRHHYPGFYSNIGQYGTEFTLNIPPKTWRRKVQFHLRRGVR